MAKVIMLIGLPGSGKTTWARTNSSNETTVHLSSDALRIEMFGFEDQTRNHLLFREMNKRTKQTLERGFDVIYDATNLNRKKRRHFINTVVREYDVECVLFYEPIDSLLRRNQIRTERKIPDLQIIRMMKSFQPPFLYEGFKKITYVGNKDKTINYGDRKIRLDEMYKEYMKYDQKSPYHSLTLGNHIKKVINNVENSDISDKDKKVLEIAAALHDLGKPLARDYDEETGRAKYIGHENISSYLTLPYIRPNEKNGEAIHTVVSYHMRAHNIKTEKSRKKLIREVGQEYYDLLTLFAKFDMDAK